MPDSVWRNLPSALESATPYLDTQNNTFVYAIDLGGDIGKVVIRVNYNEKGRIDDVRARFTSNFVRTVGVVKDYNLREANYVSLGK